MAIDKQQGRFLAQHSEQGYVTDVHLALRDEPEAVSDGEQRQLTRQAARIAERSVARDPLLPHRRRL